MAADRVVERLEVVEDRRTRLGAGGEGPAGEQAYLNNLRDYRDTIPQLFTPNALVILSTGSETRVGATFAPWKRFGEWKRIDDESEPGVVSLETAIRALCEPARLLDAVESFVAYLERPGGLVKVLAQNHRMLGVNAAIRALRDPATRDGRLGVFYLEALARAEGFEFIAVRDASVEALLVDDVTRRAYLERSNRVRRLFAAILPDPAASTYVRRVGVARNLAETIRSFDPAPDLSHVAGAAQELLDRSVGAEEYVIRAAADGADADGLIDLAEIDFDALAARLAGRQRSSAQRLTGRLKARIEDAARRNPTRLDLVEKLRALIDDHNAGSLNVDEMLRRLQALSRDLSEEERRTVREGLSEAELAVFDLLTQPDPELTDEQRDEVKRVARKLMSHIEDRLVLDWRKKAQTREAARGLVKGHPRRAPRRLRARRLGAQGRDRLQPHLRELPRRRGSVYETRAPVAVEESSGLGPDTAKGIDVEPVTASVIERIRTDRAFAELVAEQLRGDQAFFAIPSEALLGEETYAVELKSTARWNLREKRKDRRIEDAIVKTVAGFLNTDGGTLLIGARDDGRVIGLDRDLPLVKPRSADGLVNWLTTHLVNALKHPAVMRTRSRINAVDGRQLLRVDVARSSVPVMARMSDGREVLWVRMNNSTRALPEAEAEEYVRDHW